jgi:NAD(P)-dependent dehydrogenase (short-subunit alcohol dehydrogenase family)
MEGLKRKVAIVTGGATLIGAAVVRAFHREGTKVAIADINEKDGQAVADSLGKDVQFVKTDLADDGRSPPAWTKPWRNSVASIS